MEVQFDWYGSADPLLDWGPGFLLLSNHTSSYYSPKMCDQICVENNKDCEAGRLGFLNFLGSDL